MILHDKCGLFEVKINELNVEIARLKALLEAAEKEVALKTFCPTCNACSAVSPEDKQLV